MTELFGGMPRENKVEKISNFEEFMREAEKLDHEGFAKARAERAELEALRKDAERYRWLKNHAEAADWEMIGYQHPENTDAAIDSLMTPNAGVRGEPQGESRST